MSSIQRDQTKDYVRRSLDCYGDTWTPMQLPAAWYQFRAHPDAMDGIEALRAK